MKVTGIHGVDPLRKTKHLSKSKPGNSTSSAEPLQPQSAQNDAVVLHTSTVKSTPFNKPLLNPTAEKAEKVFNLLDLNQDKRINKGELLLLKSKMEDKHYDTKFMDDLIDDFDRLDTDDDGTLTFKEIRDRLMKDVQREFKMPTGLDSLDEFIGLTVKQLNADVADINAEIAAKEASALRAKSPALKINVLA